MKKANDPVAVNGGQSTGHVMVDDPDKLMQNWSEPAFYEYLKYLRDNMTWIETEGSVLMGKESPLTLDEFNSIIVHIEILIKCVPKLKPLNIFLQNLIKKGIASLKRLLNTGAINLQVAREYFLTISSNFTSDAPCGINSHQCRLEESFKMIESMIPIAQVCKDRDLVRILAVCRFAPNNELARRLFVERFAKWQD